MNRTFPIVNNNDFNNGAIFYIIIVLFWYSLGIICMLIMQIRTRDKTIDDYTRYRTKYFVENFHNQTHTKEILEELVNKEKRDKLWEIYFNRFNENEFLLKENLRIENIEKRLEMINRNFIFTHWSTSKDMPSSIRRRSSFDQQILERWKIFIEQLPCKLQKFIIR